MKNVVYKNRATGELWIANIRGDLEVNPIKLGHVVGAAGLLEPATDEDLKKIGTKHGYVHSWGHKGVKYAADLSLKNVKNFIGGQKEDETDSTNINYGRDFKADVEGDIVMYDLHTPPIPAAVPKIDPMTGLPIEAPKKTEFDPETGLPKK